MNIQDMFLNQIRINKIPVTIYLSGGHPIKGLINSFDSFCLLVEANERSSLIYKHAIASVVPQTEIIISAQKNQGE